MQATLGSGFLIQITTAEISVLDTYDIVLIVVQGIPAIPRLYSQDTGVIRVSSVFITSIPCGHRVSYLSGTYFIGDSGHTIISIQHKLNRLINITNGIGRTVMFLHSLRIRRRNIRSS